MTDEDVVLDAETLDLVEEVLDALAQGYTIEVPTDEKQEMYLEAYSELTRARRGDDDDESFSGESVPDTDGDFDFETDDILP